MKKLIIRFILIFKVMFAFSQEYTPFPTTEAIWRGSDNFMNNDIPTTICWEVKLHNIDTIINGKTYKKITTKGVFEKIVALREQDKKIYLRIENKDSLLYDFNLRVGDTLNNRVYGLNANSIIIIVTKIDSVLIDGKFRKRYNMKPGPPIIEGIGSIWGFLPRLYGYLDSSYFLEYNSVNNKVIYEVVGGKCQLSMLNNNLFEEIPELKVTPNPITNVSSLQIPESIILDKAVAFDYLGREVNTIKIVNNSLSISSKDYPKGLYIIFLYHKNKLMARSKFVVQ
jgi:hypothetical protein